jgi:hypothetical protein
LWGMVAIDMWSTGRRAGQADNGEKQDLSAVDV